MCCLTASFKHLKHDLVFSAEVCFEVENGVNKVWIQHDPKLCFKVPHPSSFSFNAGYSCAPGILCYKNEEFCLYCFCLYCFTYFVLDKLYS